MSGYDTPFMSLRDEIAEAIALDNLARKSYEHFRREQSEQRSEDGFGLVYKTRYDALEPPQPAPDVVTWDDLHEGLGALADYAGEMFAEQRQEIERLQNEIGQLRADLHVVRSALKGEIVELKGKRDAA